MIHPWRRRRDRLTTRLSIEPLEGRWLPNASPLASLLPRIEPNETIDQAHDLGGLNQPAQVVGSIGNGPAGAADVTWYEFELTNSARVDFNVSTPAGNRSFASVLSLYNNDPQDYGDPYDLNGHRLLSQTQANPSSGAAACSQDLGPGDYFVAISGAGNCDFSPVIADSGLDGATGNYELSITATDLGLSGDGPTVLSSDPAACAVVASSPLAIRLDLSGPLDANTILAGQNVQLFFSPAGTPGGGAGTSVALASVNFSPTANELQLFPVAPLAPGNYTVSLTGYCSAGQTVLTTPDGVPLGEDAARPAGVDESVSFEVDGVDGVPGATGSDDTPATAQQLGNVAGAGLIQMSGAIGVDPSFNPNLSPDPTNPEPQYIPANQVDLYHFEITGPGRYAMLAEVFAGRIGSPLDSGISLFELDPSSGSLIFLAGNNNTLDPTQGTDGSIPLFTDSALTAGLTAGDYYLAVADGSNTPSPLEGQMPGSPGIFDPNQPGSAQNGWSSGPYVLNLLVQAAPNPPRILASSPSSGQVLDQAPTQLTVQFSEPMNIQQLAYQAYETSYQATLPQVYVEGSDGTNDYPRFLSYDRATNQATFQMLDGLANGQYTLHLSGPGGLTDLGGNPLVGNNPSGDYVLAFQVQGPDRGISGNMTAGYTIQSQAGQGVPQDIGVLFPRELQAGVTVIRSAGSTSSPTPSPTQDEYVIQLIQNQEYSFSLSGDDLPDGIQVTVTDALGQTVPLLCSPDGLDYFAPMSAGTYTVAVGGWTTEGQSPSPSYQLTIDLLGTQDNAPPLVDGPAPLLQIHLDSAVGIVSPISSEGFSSSNNPGPGGSTSSGSGETGGGNSAGSGNGGVLSVSLPAATGVGLAQYGTAGGLASLGMSPLGGVGGQPGTAAPAPLVQVALGRAATPVFDQLVSLIALTQIISIDPQDERFAAVEALEQPRAGTIDGPRADGDPPIELASMRGTTDSLESGAATIKASEPAGREVPMWWAALPWTMSSDPPPTDRELTSEVAEAVMPAGPGRAEELVDASPSPDARVGVDRHDTEQAAGTMTMRLVIMTATIAAAVRARPAIQGLKWRKRAPALGPRPAGPVPGRPRDVSTTVTWPIRGDGQAPLPGPRHLPALAGSSRCRDKR